MNFTSLSYYLFLALSLVVFVYSPKHWRTPILIIASLIFYLSFNPYYMVFILSTVLVSFFSALFISKAKSENKRTAAMSFAVSLELVLLFMTKYWNPLAESTHILRPINILVPLGISFYSFQSMGYVLDVYRGVISAEKHFGRYALFVSFFPHLLAGPIEPAQHFFPQIDKPTEIDQKILFSGVLLILAGLFKKLVIADHLGSYVDLVFNDPKNYKGASVALAAVLAKYQIYCDFSGYTDIALGSAMMFGFKLTPNFNRPFFSKSITEYWNRWHISLSTWIKNYIFYPLLTTPATVLGARGLAIITFLVLGLWHGGTKNFLIYGLIQGVLIALDSSTKKQRSHFYSKIGLNHFPKLLSAINIAFTFFILVVPPTIFFRAPHFSDSLLLFHNMTQNFWDSSNLNFVFKSMYLTQALTTAVPAIVIFEIIDWIQKTRFNISDWISSRSMGQFIAIALVLLMTILLLGKFEAGTRFIYTQF